MTVAERPTRSGALARSRASTSILTGTRCTTLIQLPDAFCAGSSANAAPVPADMPVTRPWNKCAASVEVAAHLGGLADAQIPQLHFLEIRIDPQLIERNHGHQRLAGLDVLPQLHAAIGDVAGDGREHRVALGR